MKLATDVKKPFGIEAVFPNPVAAVAKIQFYLSSPGDVQLNIVNESGILVAVLIHSKLNTGAIQQSGIQAKLYPASTIAG